MTTFTPIHMVIIISHDDPTVTYHILSCSGFTSSRGDHRDDLIHLGIF